MNDGIYNYDTKESSANDMFYPGERGGGSLLTTPRKRLQNPQHIKVMVKMTMYKFHKRAIVHTSIRIVILDIF